LASKNFIEKTTIAKMRNYNIFGKNELLFPLATTGKAQKKSLLTTRNKPCDLLVEDTFREIRPMYKRSYTLLRKEHRHNLASSAFLC
jgi:predicted transglutaminase-like cysteine proteinase